MFVVYSLCVEHMRCVSIAALFACVFGEVFVGVHLRELGVAKVL